METTEKIEILIKALGTMVMTPQFKSTEVIGEKVQIQPLQQGILQGDLRSKAESKLGQLIDLL